MEIYPEKHEQLELTSNERSFLRTISRAFDEYENSYYVLHINPRRIDLGGGKPELFNLLVFDMGLLLFRFIEVEDVSIAKLTIESMAQKIVFNKIDNDIYEKLSGSRYLVDTNEDLIFGYNICFVFPNVESSDILPLMNSENRDFCLAHVIFKDTIQQTRKEGAVVLENYIKVKNPIKEEIINNIFQRLCPEITIARKFILNDYAYVSTLDSRIGCIRNSKANQEKSICFVTGVPGAGKTLVGLDVAVKQTYQGQDEPIEEEQAVYLSGNGPLVAVLNEALAQDNYKKNKGAGKKLSDARREVSKSIQIIHRYRDNMLAKIKNPVENGVLEIDPEKAVKYKTAGFGEVEHVAIFDEAQRSWTHKRLADYLKRGGTYGNKLKVPNFPLSEAAFLIWSLDQREDWATIVCLVGGGQEINTGEAGISEWIKALNEQFSHWNVYISPKLTDAEYAEGKVNELLKDNANVTYSEDLHLGVSLRSYRAEKLSAFVHALLSFDESAAKLYSEIKDKYPIVLTRDMAKAKQWLHSKVRGTERTGVLVTKESARFKPLSIHVLPSGDENAMHWFLDDKTDVRSSNYLEDAATEIQVQGLELDYTCLLWDADMRYENGEWHFYKFNGQTRWTEQIANTESKQELQKYMLNAYRVLLTRARAGMVICVPTGNPNKTVSGFWEDSTRLPEFYDGTYKYLKSLGIEEI